MECVKVDIDVIIYADQMMIYLIRWEGETMDYLSHNVAVNLKRIRTSKAMSLDVAAEQTGVSKSMLAQIERGGANPSLGVLGKIASGLRISFQELIEAPPMDSCLVRVEDTIPTKELEGQYRVWTCFPYEDNKVVEIYRIEIEPGAVYVSGGHGEKTREYISVLKGEVVSECNGEKHVVTPADVFRFEADQTHRYYNITKERICFMCIFLDYH